MASIRRTCVALLFASLLTAGTAAAQPAPFNEIGVTMGHWHIVSKDIEANKKLFLSMGGKLFMPGGNPVMMFPGVYINLNLNAEKGDGGTVGSVVNHVGFIVDNVQRRVAQWKAAGVDVLPGNSNRLDQAFVVTPDGVRREDTAGALAARGTREERVVRGTLGAGVSTRAGPSSDPEPPVRSGAPAVGRHSGNRRSFRRGLRLGDARGGCLAGHPRSSASAHLAARGSRPRRSGPGWRVSGDSRVQRRQGRSRIPAGDLEVGRCMNPGVPRTTR